MEENLWQNLPGKNYKRRIKKVATGSLIILLLCTLFCNKSYFGPGQANTKSIGTNENKLKDFKKYYILPASPEEVYLALTSPAVIQLWTGEKAEMSTEPGSEFSLWEESISGKNLEFEKDKKIVQQWYFDQEEPSIVTIKLHPHKNGTSVELRHTNIPEGEYDGIVEGWDENYFASLEEFYEGE